MKNVDEPLQQQLSKEVHNYKSLKVFANTNTSCPGVYFIISRYLRDDSSVPSVSYKNQIKNL